MTVVFASNYFNHHQAPFSKAMDRLTMGNYYFIETEEMPLERIKFGYGGIEKPPYVLKWSAETADSIQKRIDNADIVIAGSAPEALLKNRLKSGKLLFRYSERWYKNGFPLWKLPYRLILHYLLFGRYKNTYMLCSSAYTAQDCAKTGLFLRKTYKWGYFPEVKHYENIDGLMASKQSNTLLWAGRFLDWKHPELPLQVAKKLKEEGYRFTLKMIGNGALENQIKEQVHTMELEDCVQLLGAMQPEKVRTHMEQSEIFLFTSDFKEGWGAVLNESMNSGCAVVASHAIGSVPFLLKNENNGMIYRNGDFEDCYQKVKFLLDHPDSRRTYGKEAYKTLAETWNAEVAAERILQLATAILNGDKKPDLFKEGPCSKADIISNHWFHS